MKKLSLLFICIILMLSVASCDENGKNEGEHKHDFSIFVVDKEPLCTAEGSGHYQCSECGEADSGTVSIEKTTHKYSPDYSYNAEEHWHLCTECGDATSKESHIIENGRCLACNQHLAPTEGLVYSVDKTTNSAAVIGYNGTDTSIVIDRMYDGRPVTRIAANAFNSKEITSVIIPNSVTRIGEYAFAECGQLENVIFSEITTEIANGAFAGCTKIRSFYDGCVYVKANGNPYYILDSAIDQNIKSTSAHKDTKIISFAAFEQCTSLENIILPEGLKIIGDRAFMFASALKEIKIPDSTTKIGAYAFACCTSLAKADMGMGIELIGASAFMNCQSLNTIIFNGKAKFTMNGKPFEYTVGVEIVYYKCSRKEAAPYDLLAELPGAKHYYYSETEPQDKGNYWHYGENSEILIWK